MITPTNLNMNETNIVNLTPHKITLCGSDKRALIEIPPSGNIARVETRSERIGSISVNGIEIPVSRTQFGAVTGLPEPQPGTAYIVSLAVRTAVPQRADVFSPGELVRGPDGQPVGCLGLVSN